jgi:uncharacterized membrane protein
MPEAVGGVPLHPLVVHAVVVLLPLAALGVIAVAVVPKWRSRFGVLVAGTAVVALALTPVATQSGENLEEVVGESDLVQKHAELGDKMLYGAVPLAIVAVLLWWLGRRVEQGHPLPRWVSLLVPIVSVIVAIAVLVQVILVGHSGAKSVWG